MVLSLGFSFSVFMITSNHISGKAIDMTIKWSGSIKVKKKTKPKYRLPIRLTQTQIQYYIPSVIHLVLKN